MKTSGLFIVGIMAGGLLLGGCGAEKADNRPTEITEKRETDAAETEAASDNAAEEEPEEEHGKPDEAELIYGEMTEDFYIEIEDTFALIDRDDVVVVGKVHNSPLYVDAEVDVLSDGYRMETGIGGIEVYGEMVDCAEPDSNVGVMLTGLGEEDVHAGDIIVLRGCDNPVEKKEHEISAIVEELAVADIPEEKAYIPAYAEVIQQLEAEWDEITYEFIYLNDDRIPELVAGHSGYWVSVYTFAAGEVYTVMDDWGYGAMGNSGYDYLPQENVIRNYNTDLAGIILYTTYCRMNDSYEAEVFCSLEQSLRDDEGNYPEDSEAAEKAEWHFYYEEQEISLEEYNSYDIPGEYDPIIGSRTALEMLEEMRKTVQAE